MKVLTILRFFESPDSWFGALYSETRPICLTLELPWQNNKPDISCVPLGEYLCKRTESPHFGNTFEVTGVPGGRTHVLFHKGNTHLDSRGCIILGSSFGWVAGVLGVLSSKQAFEEFEKELEGEDEFKLIIKS